ncbi:glycosyltransferase family 2 protein [Tessaracoccus sp. Z1128]
MEQEGAIEVFSELVVIIPALNAASTLARQLEALDAQSDLEFSVIISDNGSSDATRSIAQRWRPRFRGITVVDASQRRGVAHARNVGITACKEQLILICDADDRVCPEWVASMRIALSEADAVTGPLLIVTEEDETPRVTWNAGSLPTAMGYLPYVPGGNLGVRREAFEAVGGFDEEMSLGQEDVDFGWRLVREGFSLGHSVGACLYYYQRRDWLATVRQQARYGRAHVALYLKHRDEGIRVASGRTSARWFIEWAKQFPGAAAKGDVRDALGSLSFQLARSLESMRWRTATPL